MSENEILTIEKLPEKWCVRITPDNYKDIWKWANWTWEYNNNNIYCTSRKTHSREFPDSELFTEITFEQFKKLVLKQNNMENKSIKINIPEGMEIDKEKSSFEEIVFKSKEKQLPKTWEELKEVKGYYVDMYSIVKPADAFAEDNNRNVFPTKELAEAALALAQLLQLRDAYNDGWIPNWEGTNGKYVITKTLSGNKIKKDIYWSSYKLMTFKTEELRDKFFDNFQDLLQIANPLL